MILFKNLHVREARHLKKLLGVDYVSYRDDSYGTGRLPPPVGELYVRVPVGTYPGGRETHRHKLQTAMA